MKKDTAIVILAAGMGKRMKNPNLPKVLVEMLGKPLLAHVMDEAQKIDPKEIVVITGHMREKVDTFLAEKYSFAKTAIQEEQLGTGHAVDQAEAALKDFEGNVLILCGDVPLLRHSTLKNFINFHNENNADCSVLSADAPDPTGYGRIVRDSEGNFLKIVEHKDATEAEKEITEFNSGVYFVDAKLLFNSLKQVSNDNAQGEYYLTDIIEILAINGKSVQAYKGAKFEELLGVNSPEQLEECERYHKLLNG